MEPKKPEDLEQQRAQVQRKLDENVQEGIPFHILFPPGFMRENTKFGTMDEFLTASPFKIENQDDFAQIDPEAWNAYVKENTNFGSWDEMKGMASAGYLEYKLRNMLGS